MESRSVIIRDDTLMVHMASHSFVRLRLLGSARERGNTEHKSDTPSGRARTSHLGQFS